MHGVHRLVRTLDTINSVIINGTVLLIFPLIFVMLFDVIMRYWFDAPTVWGSQVSFMIFGVYMIFAGPCSVLDKVQVGVDIFSARWSVRTQAIVQCITYIFVLIFFYALISVSLLYAVESWEMKEISSSAWAQPIYQWKALIPVAFTLTLLQTFADFLRNLWLACTGREL